MLAKPEWGVKRTCLACSTRFYDMQKDPITCPNCGAIFDVETIFRPRRSRAAAEEPAIQPESPVASDEDIEKQLAALADDSIDEDADAAGDDDDDSTIPDTSDLENDEEEISAIPKDFSNDSS
ncbi:MAG: TIGR02300 family protein [Rhodospirillales bacterium]|nr:TIGR02300 family protein [Rhodospirillales bacterium]